MLPKEPARLRSVINPWSEQFVFSYHAHSEHKRSFEEEPLMAMVSSTSSSATPTGEVTLDMVIPKGTMMKGMKSGTTVRGFRALRYGMATFTAKPSLVLNIPLKFNYGGSRHFKATTVTPPAITTSDLQAPSTGGGMGMNM